MTTPLTPKDCDLRDFQFMPMDISRLFGSRFHAVCSDAEWRAGVTLWLKSFHQVPAASLPDDDVELCRLAELGRDIKAWKKVRENALHGWEKCEDGRLYHKVVAEKAMEAWGKKQSYRERSKKGNSKRWGSQKDVAEQSFSDPSGIDKGVLQPPKGQGQGQGQGQGLKAAAARDAGAYAGGSDAEYLARISATQPDDNRRMVVMADGWQPCEKFEDQARLSGIDPDLLTSDALAKFRIFYDGQERLANRWNLALIDWLKRERPANVADIRAAKPKPVEKKTEYWKPDPKRMMTEEELAVLHAGRALLK